jgi:hypothetical protein
MFFVLERLLRRFFPTLRLEILCIHHNVDSTFRKEPVQQRDQKRVRLGLICSNHYFLQDRASFIYPSLLMDLRGEEVNFTIDLNRKLHPVHQENTDFS